jgi:hypothetical protein
MYLLFERVANPVQYPKGKPLVVSATGGLLLLLAQHKCFYQEADHSQDNHEKLIRCHSVITSVPFVTEAATRPTSLYLRPLYHHSRHSYNKIMGTAPGRARNFPALLLNAEVLYCAQVCKGQYGTVIRVWLCVTQIPQHPIEKTTCKDELRVVFSCFTMGEDSAILWFALE